MGAAIVSFAASKLAGLGFFGAAGAVFAHGAIIAAGINFAAVYGASRILRKKADFDDSDFLGGTVVRGGSGPAFIAYGQCALGGSLADIRVDNRTTSHGGVFDLHHLIAHAYRPGGIDSIAAYWLDDERIPNTTAHIDSEGIKTGKFGKRTGVTRAFYIKSGDGTQTVANGRGPHLLAATFDQWSATGRAAIGAPLIGAGTDVVYSHIRMRLTDASKEVYSNGPPNFRMEARWNKVYDPRKDSTRGGAGSHRFADPSTWEWSDNPALCCADYLTQYVQGVDEDGIDWIFVVEWADNCDEQVAIPGGGTEKRYTLNIGLSTANTHRHNLDVIFSSCNASETIVDGRHSFIPHEYKTPSQSFGEDNIIGGISHESNRWIDEEANAIYGQYNDASDGYAEKDFPSRRNQAAIDANRELPLELTYPAVTDHRQAQRLADGLLNLQRNSERIVLPLNWEALWTKVGDNIEVSYAPYGYSDKVFRVKRMEIDLLGGSASPVVIFAEEDQADVYGDLSASDYHTYEGKRILRAAQSPFPPTEFAAEATETPGELLWSWTPPDTDYDTIELWVSRTRDWAGAERIWQGKASSHLQTRIRDATTPERTRWGWVRTIADGVPSIRNPDDDVSSVGAAARQDKTEESVWITTPDRLQVPVPASPGNPVDRTADGFLPSSPINVFQSEFPPVDSLTATSRALWRSVRTWNVDTGSWNDFSDFFLYAYDTGGARVFSGMGRPDDALGSDGDVYIQADGALWEKEAGTWEDTGISFSPRSGNRIFVGPIADGANPSNTSQPGTTVGDLFISNRIGDARWWRWDGGSWTLQGTLLGNRGPGGPPGRGIDSVERIGDEITVNYTTGSPDMFTIRDGLPGRDITITATEVVEGGVSLTFSDGTTLTLPTGPRGVAGRGISDIVYDPDSRRWTISFDDGSPDRVYGVLGTQNWYSGIGAPNAGLGLDGDFYLRVDEHLVYRKVAGSWDVLADLSGADSATWHSGTGEPSESTGNNGDFYFRTTDATIWRKNGGVWTQQIDINGEDGSTWHSGTGAPSSGIGNVGDFYFRTGNGFVYEKTGSTIWAFRRDITGPDGEPGDDGLDGYSVTPPAIVAWHRTASTASFDPAGTQTSRVEWLLDGTVVAWFERDFQANANGTISQTASRAFPGTGSFDGGRTISNEIGERIVAERHIASGVDGFHVAFALTDGVDGRGVVGVVRRGDEITFTYSDGTEDMFAVRDGLPGEDITIVASTTVAGGVRLTFSDGTAITIPIGPRGVSGRGIMDVEFDPATNTWTISFDDGSPDRTFSTIGAQNWYSGSGVPNDGLGEDGDFFLRTDTRIVYRKDAGSWNALVDLSSADAATWHDGSGVPPDSLGNNGDFYFRTTNATIWTKSGGTWSQRIDIDGQDGATWHSGTGVPAGGLGETGDFYFRTTNGFVYEKTASTTWTFRRDITGPDGDPGEDGLDGYTVSPPGVVAWHRSDTSSSFSPSGTQTSRVEWALDGTVVAWFERDFRPNSSGTISQTATRAFPGSGAFDNGRILSSEVGERVVAERFIASGIDGYHVGFAITDGDPGGDGTDAITVETPSVAVFRRGRNGNYNTSEILTTRLEWLIGSALIAFSNRTWRVDANGRIAGVASTGTAGSVVADTGADNEKRTLTYSYQGVVAHHIILSIQDGDDGEDAMDGRSAVAAAPGVFITLFDHNGGYPQTDNDSITWRRVEPDGSITTGSVSLTVRKGSLGGNFTITFGTATGSLGSATIGGYDQQSALLARRSVTLAGIEVECIGFSPNLP